MSNDPRAPGLPLGVSWAGPLFPSTAHWLSVVGGILIWGVGLLDVGVAIVYRSVLENILPGSTALYLVFGGISCVAGVAIMLLGFRLRSDPSTARRSGTSIILLSLVSLLGGGGLYLGLLLAFTGGVMARTWRAPTMPQLRDGFAPGAARVRQPPEPARDSSAGPPKS